MKVTIIPQDNRIIVDGKTLDLDDNDIRWAFDDEHIHAIQWRNGKGEIEYEDVEDEDPLPNKKFGEDEFDTVVKPYIDFFNEFLTVSEKKQLELSLQEEELILSEINELNVNKLQEEENILIINDLQDQNRKVREEYDKIADELEKSLEEKSISERELRLQHERELYEKDLEFQEQESKKIDEFFRKKSFEFSNHIENLVEQLEKQKEEFLEEKKQFAEYIQKYKSSIEQEVDDIQQTMKVENARREVESQIAEKQRIADEEQINLMRQTSELEQQSFDLAIEELEQQKLRLMRDRKLEIEKNSIAHQEIDKERERMLLDVALQKEHQLEERLDLEEMQNLLASNKVEKSTLEQNYLDQQIFKFDNFVHKRQETYDAIENQINTLNEKDRSNEINDVSSILDEIDPEDFYKSLTDEHRETNSFPIEKATAWFNKLKEAMERNEQ